MKNKKILVLDCETASLPITKEIARNTKEIKLLNIARPLIYDIGWVIFDLEKQKIEKKVNFLVEEIFFTPLIFNTAYYKDKRPIYIKMLNKGTIEKKKWEGIIRILKKDLKNVEYSVAYNAMFDFKKAIPFTQEYFDMLKSEHYQEWEDKQRSVCRSLIFGKRKKKQSGEEFDRFNFTIDGQDYPLKDLWGLSCQLLINKDEYKKWCINTCNVSESGLYFKTTAESVYQFLKHKFNFKEAHTALQDAIIETEIFKKCIKYKMDDGITYFPFKILGETVDFIETNKIDKACVQLIKDIMYQKLQEYSFNSPFSYLLEDRILRLEKISTKKENLNFLKMKERIIFQDICRLYTKVTSIDPMSDIYFSAKITLEDKTKEYWKIKEKIREKEKNIKKVYIYYHNYDFDGKFSGSIVDHFFDPTYKRVWVGYNYDSILSFDHITNKDYVFMVDLSPEGETLSNFEHLAERNKKVVWCDHHPASVENKSKIKGIRSNEFSGAALIYKYFNKKCSFENMPNEIRFVSDADTFSGQFIETNTFVMGLLAEETNPEHANNVWIRFLKNELTYKAFISQGTHISKFRRVQGDEICFSYGYEKIFEGIKAFCVNSYRPNISSVKNKYDLIIIWFYLGNGNYKYSLRSNDKVNCRKIAEKYGGGGHESAASFIIDKMLL